MVKINEIRVGNLFNQTASGSTEFCKILEITQFVLTYESTTRLGACNLESISPILLNKELLIKLGLERLNNAFIKDIGERNEHGEKISGEKTFTLFDYSYGHGTGLMFNHTEIKYVHQLQNLYFALYNEELNHSEIIWTL